MKRSKLLYGLWLLLSTLLLTEGGLWVLGYRPYRHASFSVRSQPRGWLKADSMLGFRLGQGDFLVAVNDGLRFQARHLPSGERFSGGDLLRNDTPLTVDLLGCSYAYGYGLNDSLTLAWRLQQSMPRALIRNRAVPGYGNVQALLQLRQRWAEGDTAEVAVLLYASFHDDRNSLSAAYRKDLSLGFAQNHTDSSYRDFRYPYCSGDDTIRYRAWNDLYQHWPGRERLATLNLLQTTSEQWQSATLFRHEWTERLIRRIAEECREAGVLLIVVSLTDDAQSHKLLNTLARANIDTLSMGLDLQDPHYQNQPWDTHPNALAHAHFAQRLHPYLLRICPAAYQPAGPALRICP